MATTVVTGAAGFIGHAVCRALLRRGDEVVGIDNFNGYYDPTLKRARAADLATWSAFRMLAFDIADPAETARAMEAARGSLVIHLAAQAGVRHSIEAPFAYERSNVAGHLSVLEACRRVGVRHLVYASSSSVYGNRDARDGFRETDPAEAPVSLYAATKRAGELLSESYSALYRIPQTGLRFFTVYGPWGRPDMAYYTFAQKIMSGEPIEIFGEGRMTRDFTFVDDAVAAILAVAEKAPTDGAHRLFNVGSGRPVGLLEMVAALEAALGRSAVKLMKPMQAGDVTATWADISRLTTLTGYSPTTSIGEGLRLFVEWWLAFAGANSPPKLAARPATIPAAAEIE